MDALEGLCEALDLGRRRVLSRRNGGARGLAEERKL